jgi:hypothetical protein
LFQRFLMFFVSSLSWQSDRSFYMKMAQKRCFLYRVVASALIAFRTTDAPQPKNIVRPRPTA